MDLSVIIVNWNVRDLLLACLQSVYMAFSAAAYDGEVLVVDNASTDGSVPAVRERFPDARVIENAHNAGFAAANNQGLRVASGRFVLLLNPDTEVEEQALARLLSFMEGSASVGMVGPRLLYGDGSLQHAAFRFPNLAQVWIDFFPIHHRLQESRLNGRYPRALYEAGEPFAVDHPLGACMMVKAEVVQHVGLMDEGFFMYCEEIDWAMRIRRAGYQVFCVPAATVVHHTGQSARQASQRMFVALWRSRFRLFSKYYSPAYNRVLRWVVQLGLLAERRRAHRSAASGQLSAQELMRRLAALQEVRMMARGA
jgi:N-acetylglucosaminyl-diphospho-decaprenol L-rhamnosyltransferase